MSDLESSVCVEGLTPLQLAELKAAIEPSCGDVVRELAADSLSGGRHGEPTLISVLLVLGPQVIAALALWLSKQKRRRTKSLRFFKVNADGSRTLVELDESTYQEGAAAASNTETLLKQVLS